MSISMSLRAPMARLSSEASFFLACAAEMSFAACGMASSCAFARMRSRSISWSLSSALATSSISPTLPAELADTCDEGVRACVEVGSRDALVERDAQRSERLLARKTHGG